MEQTIDIPVDKITVTGDLHVPELAKGIIVFAHGSGSSRHSSRNKYVARVLQEAGFATLLFDLLTTQEDEDSTARFDIELLTDRLIKVTDWLKWDTERADLAVGYFGASTGAAAALRAAATLGKGIIRAVVSRGGRPDMVGRSFLEQVKSPTLLIVGGLDEEVADANVQALAVLTAEKQKHIIPGAGHLFEEPGKLEEVASLATEWFQRYLVTLIK